MLHARTHSVTHSLAASLANKNVFNEPFAAQRLEPPRAKEWGGAPSLCLQKFAINHPIPRALHLLPQSLPSRYDRSPLFSFSLHIFPQPSPLCLSEIPIPSFPRSQPPPKWLSPSRTSGLKSPWPRELLQLSQSPSPRSQTPSPTCHRRFACSPRVPVNTTTNRGKKSPPALSPPLTKQPQTCSTPQNTPANNAPISSHAQQPGVDSIKEG